MEGGDQLNFTDAFSRVSNSTRLAIIRELAQARSESPREPEIPFSVLRERVGEPDSGTFNYHINQLRDVFIEKQNDGYVLTPEGRRFAAIVAAGGMTANPTEYPHELDDNCPVCAEPLVFDYQNGRLGAWCPNDHGWRTRVPRSFVAGQTVEDAMTLLAKFVWGQVNFARDGYCPSCFNRMDCIVNEYGETGESVLRFEAVCDRCGEFFELPVDLLLAYHPSVVAVYLPEDPEYQHRHPWELRSITRPETTIADRNPILAEVTFEKDNETVVFSVGENGEFSQIGSN